MRVLIVDDSRAIRRLQRRVLESIGPVEVVEAEDGVNAVHALRDVGFQVDLILVDWMMPRMDGLELARRLKGSPALASIPLMMVTSLSDESKMRKAADAGVDGYLLKPFSQEALLSALSILCASDDRSADSASTADGTVRLLEVVPEDLRRRIVEMSVRSELAVGDEALRAGEVVESFCFVLQGRVTQSGFSAKGLRERREFGPRACFAVAELMSGEHLHEAVVATEPTVVARLPQAAFEAMLVRYPELSFALTRALNERRAREAEASQGA